jgi:hypothetical protein
MMEDADFLTYNGFVRKVVGRVDLVATDENPIYNYLGPDMKHEAVRDSSGEYVRGTVHTNSIESFWALLKRGVVGTFHNANKEYLSLYLAEFSWRHTTGRMRTCSTFLFNLSSRRKETMAALRWRSDGLTRKERRRRASVRRTPARYARKAKESTQAAFNMERRRQKEKRSILATGLIAHTAN